MSSVGIHPPKTPVTRGCHSVAKATLPNVCKMPGPPAPFVPSPLPNIAKSELSPKGYSETVKIEGHVVAIRGATYESIGDIASKGTGGGLISANCHGPAKFITPGSLTVKIEGKNVHLLGEPMLNNCGASGSPPNTGATMVGTKHKDTKDPPDNEKDVKCAIHQCDNEPYNISEAEDDKCAALGKAKHSCVAKKLKDKEPGIKSEAFCSVDPPKVLESGGKAIKNFFQAANTIGSVATYQVGSLRRPDLIYTNKAGQTVVADAKFPCPDAVKDGTQTSGKMPSPKSSESMLTGTQKADYKAIQGKPLRPPKEIQPKDCSAEDCK